MNTDQGNVIRGLECCSKGSDREPTWNHLTARNCGKCPYNKPGIACTRALSYDALFLLKAQEPRIMAADELKEYLMINDSGLLYHDQWRELSQRAPLYMEFREPDKYQVNWWTVERLRPWAMESMFWEKYKMDRRCWTARPTDEQREAVKWEE